jgi:hypothetical protein
MEDNEEVGGKENRKEKTVHRKKKDHSLEFISMMHRKIKYIWFLELGLCVKYNNLDSKPHCKHLKPLSHRRRRVDMQRC